MDLLELAERVEGLQGPDREVDARIWCAVSPPPESYTIDSWYRGDPRPAGADVVGLTLADWLEKWPQDAAKMADSYGVPKFTASLDSAMSLVPEDVRWTLGNMRSPRTVACINAFDQATGATSALALTAAALKALASLTEINRVSDHG